MKLLTLMWDFGTGFFRDQKGQSSRKAIALYTFLALHAYIVHSSKNGHEVSHDVLLFNFIAILFCIGAITTEFFKKQFDKNNSDPPQGTT